MHRAREGLFTSVGNRSDAVKRRLVDMGLTPGTEIKVKKIAPFGDPIEVNLSADMHLSLRKRRCRANYELGDVGPEIVLQDEVTSAVHVVSSVRQPDQETIRNECYRHMNMNLDQAPPCVMTRSAHDKRIMRIALAGNPNCGKTTLFNALTGSNQYVGQLARCHGREKRGDRKNCAGREIVLVDLPGIYSLSPYSMEEIVSRDYHYRHRQVIMPYPPDAIINVIDATKH